MPKSPSFSRRLPALAALTALTTLFVSGSASVGAQSDGYTNPYTGNTWNNPISSYLDTVLVNRREQQMLNNQMFSQLLFSQMMMNSMLRKVGRERIAAGHASTRFTPSAGASQAVVLLSGETSGTDRAKAIAANRACLSGFHAALKRFGLQPYDVADARALAFTMAFTAMSGKDPGPVRLRNLRTQFRTAMLKDPMFQALPDDERQTRYEKMVIPAMIAVTARHQSLKPGIGDERKGVLVTTASRLGANLLNGLWTEPVEAIELSPTGFIDRGRRVIASGAGHTAFQRSGESVVARDVGSNYTNQSFGWDEKYQKNLLSRFDAAVQKLGLSTHDLADAQVAAAAVVYPVFSGGVSLGTPQIAWLRREMRKDILSSPDFQRMSDAKMQDQYESLALRAMHIRAQDEKMRAEIAALSQKSSDAFTNIANAGVIQADRRVLETNRVSAHELLKDIFNPRPFDDYRLAPDGFRQR